MKKWAGVRTGVLGRTKRRVDFIPSAHWDSYRVPQGRVLFTRVKDGLGVGRQWVVASSRGRQEAAEQTGP